MGFPVTVYKHPDGPCNGNAVEWHEYCLSQSGLDGMPAHEIASFPAAKIKDNGSKEIEYWYW